MNASRSRVSVVISLLGITRETGSLADRVETSVVERMAARQSAQAFAHAFQDAMLFDSVPHIFRTSRMESARRREQRRDHQLVSADQADGDRAGQLHRLLH